MIDQLKRINLELTSRCNYNCVSCPTNELLRGKGTMDIDLYKAIFDEAGDKLERAFLWNYGEPLLHSQVAELIRYSGKFSAKKVLSTNGWRLEDLEDPESLRELDELIVSINGLTPETYSIHQVNGDLEKVLRGIEKIAPIIRDSKTKFTMQAIAHKGNLDELRYFEDFAKKCGFDMFVIKSFNVMDRKQDTFHNFVPIGTEFSRYPHGLQNPPKIHEGGIYPCEEWMVINWDGSVNPCCWDYKGEHDFGNVREQGVYGIWESMNAFRHREKIRSKRFLDICNDCLGSKAVSSCSFTNKGGKDVNKSI